ncbi:hypothetical protein WISP_56504 [Willisornis vidua]|uniref:Uncharacterized protein n=1 Tax=Willisornis vidua TaxID=1566151 RepID=A0ABQ9DC33_9PASS|nr:hypothetical protein WISP_56504 [Willisornis vidua]
MRRGGWLRSRLLPSPAGHSCWATTGTSVPQREGEAGLGKRVLVQQYRRREQGGILRQRRAEQEERMDLQMNIAGVSVYSPKPPRVFDMNSVRTRLPTNIARLVPKEKAEDNPIAAEH